jgi:hypothetical protein
VKWELVAERDPAAQIAAINALLILHGVVIRHSTVHLLNQIAATRAETSKLLSSSPIPDCPEQGGT